MDRYVFPNHHLATIGRTISAGESAGFEVRDVENLRELYALTLTHWLQRFETARAEVERVADPLSYRVFRLYLAGSAHEFILGRLGLHQTLFVKPAPATVTPSTRSEWYAKPCAARDLGAAWAPVG